MSMESIPLKKNLGTLDLVLLGLGAVIGTGIFVVTGTAAANYAGPGLIFSFVLAGFVIFLMGLCYAELASRYPVVGGPYAYMLQIAGRRLAWVAGWFTIWEYLLASASVASGWSGYVNGFLNGMGVGLPLVFQASFNPEQGTFVDLIAVSMTLLVTWLVSFEAKKALRLNNFMFFIKFGIITLFIVVGIFFVEPSNWQPMFPYGFNGVASGAALLFFAFLGFDAISMAAEEVKNPQKSLPLGIFFAIGISALLYILVTLVLTGIVPFGELDVKDPVAFALRYVDQHVLASIISVGAIMTLLTVLIAMLYGLARLLYAMSKGGLLPSYMNHVNKTTGVPAKATWTAGIITSIFTGLVPLQQLAEVTNIVTLIVMMMLAIGIIVIRNREGNPKDGKFYVPFVPTLPIVAVVFSLYLIFQLSLLTWILFFVISVIGFIIYYYNENKTRLDS